LASHDNSFYETKPTTNIPPVYPCFVALNIILFGDNSFLVIEIIQALVSAAFCFTLYLISKRIFGRRSIALLSAVMAAFYPSLIYHAAFIWSTIVFVFLITVLILLFIKIAERPNLINIILCGFVMGFTALTDPAILPYYPLVILWLFFNFNSKKLFIVKKISIMILIMAAIIAPWTIRNYLVFNKIILIKSNIGYNFWIGNNPYATGSSMISPEGDYSDIIRDIADKDEVDKSRYFVKVAVANIMSDPLEFSKRCLRKFTYFWWRIENKIGGNWEKYTAIMYFTYGIPLFLSVLGIFLSWKDRKYCSLIWLLFFSFSAVYSITHCGNYRYRLPVEPFILIFASVAIVRGYELTKNFCCGSDDHRVHQL
jgi:4-amino-4-deoxy-L-arabinose transferase-like glycosyltransferase